MYGSYAANDSHDRDAPECSTYPRSVGRTGASGLFARKWGNRIREDLKPKPIKWNFDDDNDEDFRDNPAERHQLTDTASEALEDNDTGCPAEEEEDDQSYASISNVDNHHDNGSHPGSVSKHFTETTYPTSRLNRSGAFNAFSSYVVPTKGSSFEATPWKSSFLKTLEKTSRCEKASESMLMKTPLPERSITEDNSNFCGDSGIDMMASKYLNASNKSSVRGLFTPGQPKSVSCESHDIFSGFLPLHNKLPNVIEESICKKPVLDKSTPLLPKSKATSNQLIMGEETPMKSIPLERTDIMELVKIHKSEKKCAKSSSHFENMFDESNKENFTYGMQCDHGPSLGPEKEKEEIKFTRSVSHASIMRHENGNMVTPSKEDRPSSARSLSNLFHPNQNTASKVSHHSSRIPTPVRSHTPQKPKTPVTTNDSAMDTSCVEMEHLQTPCKYSSSPEKDGAHEQKPNEISSAKPLTSSSFVQPNPSLINNLISLLDKAPANLTDEVVKPCYNQFSAPIQNQHPSATSNTNGVFIPPATHGVQSSGIHPYAKTSSFAFSDMALNKNDIPSCIFQSAAKSLEPQGNHMQKISPNLGAIKEPPPFFAVPNATHKPFSLRAPSFNPTQKKNDCIHDSKNPGAASNAHSSMATATSRVNPSNFQLPSSHSLPHSFVEPAAVSHFNGTEEVKQPQQIQNAPKVNSKPFEGQHPNVQTSVMALNQPSAYNCQPATYNQPAAFNSHSTAINESAAPNSQTPLLSKSNPISSTQTADFVCPSSLPMNACGSRIPPVTASSTVSQPVENPHLVEKVMIPPMKEPEPVVKVAPLARPVSVQTNRKILVVNKKYYEVLRLLGMGASSKVYDVLDCQTNRCVAVKRVILRKGDASVEGYLKEVELLNQLQGSECIITLLDSEIRSEREHRVLYMVMERGEMDLSTSIKLISVSASQQMCSSAQPGGKIPTVTIIFYWVSMLNAVDEIHRKGIVHSDLKPANFLLVGGHVKLIDFGIATSVQVDATSVLKEDPAGTPNYMSPEAIGLNVSGSPNSQNMFKSPKASYKSDVWSLGCILYSLVYGRSPFQHIKNERVKLDVICNPKYAIPFPSDSPVHPPLLKAMKRCLVRNYKDRASIAELKSIDYLCGNGLDEQSWNSWKAVATEKILSALTPECKMHAIKVIEEVFQSPPVANNIKQTN